MTTARTTPPPSYVSRFETVDPSNLRETILLKVETLSIMGLSKEELSFLQEMLTTPPPAHDVAESIKSQYWIMGTGIYRPFSPPTKPSEADLICNCETVEQAHAIRAEIIRAASTVQESFDKLHNYASNNVTELEMQIMELKAKQPAHDVADKLEGNLPMWIKNMEIGIKYREDQGDHGHKFTVRLPVLKRLIRAASTPSAEVQALREALEFYAEPQNQAREYHQSGCGITFDHGSPYSNDKGERARKALNQPHTGDK